MAAATALHPPITIDLIFIIETLLVNSRINRALIN
jgi:hypothetical protein